MNHIPEWVNVIAAWWTVLMWLLGALLATFGLVLAVQAAAWKVYKELHGWPTVFKAMKAYHTSKKGTPFLCHSPQDGSICTGWLRARAELVANPLPQDAMALLGKWKYSPPDDDSTLPLMAAIGDASTSLEREQ